MQDRLQGTNDRVGPVLHLRGHDNGRLRLAALLVVRGNIAPLLRTALGDTWPEQIAMTAGHRVLRYSFELPCGPDAWYEIDGSRYEVATDFGSDIRVAFVSCNGQEEGDLSRSEDDRNEMWHRLCDLHRREPISLLLQGGDQLYADELTEAHPLTGHWPRAPRATLTDSEAAELSDTLREAFFLRYVELLSQPGLAWISARVPTLCMWDDHDICDGWGSLKEYKLDSKVGRILFAAAREHFLLFQCAGGPGEALEIFEDPKGVSFTWCVALPGLTLIAPDLRSERRPQRVMGNAGWTGFRSALEASGPGRVLVVSSVPALGPRLSILEGLMRLTPHMEKYEDDLRDQWQSHAHRAEWQAFLSALIEVHQRPDTRVTVLSGEIHLATRGTMRTEAGDLHQLVASGISHPAPPRAWGMFLSALARLGEAPLPDHPIRLHPLPGRRGIYRAERNYLILERKGTDWTAVWDLETSGPTEPMGI
jgi:PhoD related phosphatase